MFWYHYFDSYYNTNRHWRLASKKLGKTAMQKALKTKAAVLNRGAYSNLWFSIAWGVVNSKILFLFNF